MGYPRGYVCLYRIRWTVEGEDGSTVVIGERGCLKAGLNTLVNGCERHFDDDYPGFRGVTPGYPEL